MNYLIHSFLFADIYEEVESIIKKNLIRKEGYLILTEKELQKINGIIFQSVWFKYVLKTYDAETFIKQLMILEEKDILKIHEKQLLIKKYMPYGTIRNEFRTIIASLDIENEIPKYIHAIIKSDKNELLLIFKLFENMLLKIYPKELVKKINAYYSYSFLMYSLYYVFKHTKSIPFKLNSIPIDYNLLIFISKSVDTIKENEKKVIKKQLNLEKAEEELKEIKLNNLKNMNFAKKNKEEKINLEKKVKELRKEIDNYRNKFYNRDKSMVGIDYQDLIIKIDKEEEKCKERLSVVNMTLENNLYYLQTMKNTTFLAENKVNYLKNNIKKLQNFNKNLIKNCNLKLQYYFKHHITNF